MGEYELCVICEYELWVYMIYGYIWFMCKYELWVNIRLLPSWPLVNILTGPVHFRVTLDTLSGYPEPWSSEILGSEIESTH